MTGDRVNDAPALRQAEVGIAVSTATDVAKGAASVVLTEAGLTNIVTLVEQGRTIYQRILTWIINKTVVPAGSRHRRRSSCRCSPRCATPPSRNCAAHWGNAAIASAMARCGDSSFATGLGAKKSAHAAEQDRPDILKRRWEWFEAQPDLDPERLVFINETWASTNMARTHGWAPRGDRLRAAIPHGHWKTTTFVAG